MTCNCKYLHNIHNYKNLQNIALIYKWHFLSKLSNFVTHSSTAFGLSSYSKFVCSTGLICIFSPPFHNRAQNILSYFCVSKSQTEVAVQRPRRRRRRRPRRPTAAAAAGRPADGRGRPAGGGAPSASTPPSGGCARAS